MFERVLVPLDLSPRHLTAVDVAARVVAAGGRITLIHVVEVIPGVGPEEDPDFYQRLEARALAHLESAQARLEDAGARGEVVLRYGDRAREIVRQVEEAGADLVVLGSHRIDPDDPGAGWGTLSYKVGILAPCPVLLVK